MHFANKANRPAEDAVSTLLHLQLEHLENKNTYARILFIDFFSLNVQHRLAATAYRKGVVAGCGSGTV